MLYTDKTGKDPVPAMPTRSKKFRWNLATTIFFSLIPMLGGCVNSKNAHPAASLQPVWIGLHLEPTGKIFGSPFHQMDDQELQARFKGLRSDSAYDLTLEVADARTTSYETVTRAIERLRPLIPEALRRRVKIKVTSPHYAPKFDLTVDP